MQTSSRSNKSFIDYIPYFREGKLKDTEIAILMSVSHVNVWKMRRKWEQVKDSPEYSSSSGVSSSSEDEFASLIAKNIKAESLSSNTRFELEHEINLIGIDFIKSFRKYFCLEFSKYYEEASRLEDDILSIKVNLKSSKLKRGDIFESLNQELEEKINALSSLKKQITLKEMSLLYDALLKLNSIANLGRKERKGTT
ncbi:hypothetical protein DB313_06100 (plasmid) [Borrelia turcica IST7]|uniref:DUF603 domain-containing protein n=1 Tax=Borrelia turcica IST7 TaxID=1104446 RepID=A0A386PPK3_9SPIR|nr:DUF603 domain-containing protein [Borrelia turcica]AYE37072.1 hypothetical protein DB313_06100 [Borrelia turcica IST7]